MRPTRPARAAALLVLVAALTAPATAVADVEIVGVATPDAVQAGTTLWVNVTVANRGDTDFVGSLDVTAAAFGQTKRVTDLSLDAGDRRTVRLNMTVPRDASGSATLDLTADVGDDRDLAAVDVPIQEFRLTMTLSPSSGISVGDHVTISGQMSTRHTRGTVYIDNRQHGFVRSDTLRQYRYTFTAERAGKHSVRVQVGDVHVQKLFDVDPRLAITAVTMPDRVGAGNPAEVCTTVETAAQRTVNLTVRLDGAVAGTRSLLVSGSQEACLVVRADAAGDHTVTVAADSGDAAASRDRTLTVVPSTVDVSIRPDQLTLLRGEAGIIEASIANEKATPQQFTVDLGGLANITESTARTITVGSGETRTVYLRVVPSAVGTYTGKVSVRTDDAVHGSRSVTVQAVEDPALRDRPLGARAAAVADRVGSLVRTRGPAAAGAVAVIVLLVVLYLRIGRSTPLEPRR